MSPDGCKVLLALPDPNWKKGMGEYEVTDEFINRLGLDRDFVLQQLEDSYYSGDIIFDEELGPVITPTRGLWIDIQNSRRWFDRNGPAYYRIIGIMLEQEYTPLMEQDVEDRIKMHKHGMGRIVPRYDSVKDCPDLLPVENYKEILKSRKIVSQNQCACRVRYPEYGQDYGVCLSGDSTADFMIKRELGTEIHWEDAFEYVRKAGRKSPMCHVAKHCMDMKDMGNVFCNCNAHSCAVMRNTINTGGKHKVWEYFTKSRFRAVLNPEKCIKCGLCKDKRCMFDAIHQKYLRDFGDEGLYVDENLCMGCGCCVETCPTGALTMKLVDPPETLLGYDLDENGKPMIPGEEQKSNLVSEEYNPFNASD
jgi:ferredoxin